MRANTLAPSDTFRRLSLALMAAAGNCVAAILRMSGPAPAFSGPDKMHRKPCAAFGAVFDRDGAAMRVDNAPYNRKPEAGTAGLAPVTTPEALKDHFSLGIGNALAAIEHAQIGRAHV